MSSDVPDWSEPEEPRRPRSSAAADRVKGPAIFLIIIGVLNLLLACLMLAGGMLFRNISDDQFREALQKGMNPQQRQELEKAGYTPESLKAIYSDTFTYWGIASLVAGVVIVFGGARMIMLRSYGFAIVAAVVAMVPFLTCCCGLSQGIGLWALIVLFNSEVRDAFR